MKALLLLAITAVVCVVLFVVGVFSPRRSSRMQRSVDRWARKGERKSSGNAGKVGDATSKAVSKLRKAADTSAKKGREVHDRFTS